GRASLPAEDLAADFFPGLEEVGSFLRRLETAAPAEGATCAASGVGSQEPERSSGGGILSARLVGVNTGRAAAECFGAAWSAARTKSPVFRSSRTSCASERRSFFPRESWRESSNSLAGV